MNEKKIVIHGVEYSSYHDAATAYGVSPTTFSSRLKRGFSPEDAVAPTRRKKAPMQDLKIFLSDLGSFNINGVDYKDVDELCEAYNVDRTLFLQRLRRGKTPEEALDQPRQMKTPITVRGITYPSNSEAAKAHGISVNVFVSRLHHGWTAEEALELVPREKQRSGNDITIDGKTFASHKTAADYYNLEYRTFTGRLNRGWTPEEAAGLKPHNTSKIAEGDLIVEGKIFDSIAHMAKHYGILKQTLHLRIKNGWSLEEACGVVKREGRSGHKITIEGKTFRTYQEAVNHYGIKYDVFLYRIKEGWTPEEAVGLKPSPTRR